MPSYQTVIIGSGLGGLLCGYILAREGQKVCVLEKNAETGGCIRSFKKHGHVFDTGLHYMGAMDEGQLLNRYFRYFGLTQRMKLKRMDEMAFDVVTFGNEKYPYAQGFHNFKEQLSSFFPAEENAISSYCSAMQDICDKFPLYNLTPPDGNTSEAAHFGINTWDMIKSLTSNETLQQVLAGTNFNYAGLAEKSPFYLHSLITNSFIQSAWKPVGGGGQIADLLVESIRSFGGEVITNEEITSLEIVNNRVEFALTKSGEKFEANHFISDLHPSKAIELASRQAFRPAFVSRVNNLPQTSSVFTIYVVFRENSFPFLNSNYFGFREKNVWQADKQNIGGLPGMYLLCTSADEVDNGFAGSAVIMTYMNVKEVQQWAHTMSGNRGESYEEFKLKKAEQLFDLVEREFPAFRSKVKSYFTSSPLTYRDYTGTPDGSMYGIMKESNDPFRSAVPTVTKIPNLILTGQNTLLHGVIGVTIGAVHSCSHLIGAEYLLKKINDAG